MPTTIFTADEYRVRFEALLNVPHLIIAGTGHRPDKLGGYSDTVRNRLTDLAIAYLSRRNPTHVISGMALGWDTALALAAIKLDIPLIAAVPFKGQESRWQSPDRDRFNYILSCATEIVIVCDGGYSAAKMQRRNEWMTDKCDRLVALHDGSAGGTGNCINYAQSRGVAIDNLWNSWTKYKGI